MVQLEQSNNNELLTVRKKRWPMGASIAVYVWRRGVLQNNSITIWKTSILADGVVHVIVPKD
jgi:hypothetical protein